MVNVFPKFDTNIPFIFLFFKFWKKFAKKNADLNNVLGHKCLLCIKAQAYGAITTMKCQIIEVTSSKLFKAPSRTILLIILLFFTPRHKLIPQHYILVYIFNTNIIALIFYHVFCTSYFCNFFRNGLI